MGFSVFQQVERGGVVSDSVSSSLAVGGLCSSETCAVCLARVQRVWSKLESVHIHACARLILRGVGREVRSIYSVDDKTCLPAAGWRAEQEGPAHNPPAPWSTHPPHPVGVSCSLGLGARREITDFHYLHDTRDMDRGTLKIYLLSQVMR